MREITQKPNIATYITILIITMLGLSFIFLGFNILNLGQEESRLWAILGIPMLIISFIIFNNRFMGKVRIENNILYTKGIFTKKRYDIREIKTIYKLFSTSNIWSAPIDNDISLQIVLEKEKKAINIINANIHSRDDLRRVDEFIRDIKKVNNKIKIRVRFFDINMKLCEIVNKEVYYVENVSKKDGIDKEKLNKANFEIINDEYKWFFG